MSKSSGTSTVPCCCICAAADYLTILLHLAHTLSRAFGGTSQYPVVRVSMWPLAFSLSP